MRERIVVRAAAFSLMLALVPLLTACAPSLQQVETFGVATDTVAEYAEKAFREADERAVERNLLSVARDPQRSRGTRDFEGILAPEDLAARLAVLDGLRRYAAALVALASADAAGDIEAASTTLFASVGDLNRSAAGMLGAAPISDGQLGAVASLVTEAAVAATETRKRAALSGIVRDTDPAVQEIAALLCSELCPPGPTRDAGAVGASLLASLDTIVTHRGQAFRAAPNPATRQAALQAYRDAYVDHREARELLEQITLSLEAMSKAHAVLASTSFDDLPTEEVIRTVATLVAMAGALEGFREELFEHDRPGVARPPVPARPDQPGAPVRPDRPERPDHDHNDGARG